MIDAARDARWQRVAARTPRYARCSLTLVHILIRFHITTMPRRRVRAPSLQVTRADAFMAPSAADDVCHTSHAFVTQHTAAILRVDDAIH